MKQLVVDNPNIIYVMSGKTKNTFRCEKAERSMFTPEDNVLRTTGMIGHQRSHKS